MKKLSICRNCKRRFLIEPGQDNCPKCGGPLYKTNLDEQYWELYSEDQRAEIFSKLMVEMEQNTGADAGSTASQAAGSAASAFKNPAVLLGAAAACILLVAAITISGKTRKEASGTVTAEASVAESVNDTASASSEEAESPDELEPAGPNEDNPDLSNSETANQGRINSEPANTKPGSPESNNPEPTNPESANSELASLEPTNPEAAESSSAGEASASSGTSGDPTIDYILSHTEAAREAGANGQAAANAQNPEASAACVSGASGVSGSNAAGSTGTSGSSGAAGAGGNETAVQPYVYKGMMLDLPVDAEIMPQGPGIYAYLYTRDNKDVIAFKYDETGPLDLSAARAMTKAEMDDFIASQNNPGYDGLLSFSVSEINGYPMITCSYHATGDSLILVTEKSIYLETGYYRVYTFDITGENTDALNAALDSVRLTR